MHAQVAAELKADGYAILSEFTREPSANVEFEPQEKPIDPENSQVCARTGKPVSGKATSGETVPINHSSDKELDSDKQPPLVPPTEVRRRRVGATASQRIGKASSRRPSSGCAPYPSNRSSRSSSSRTASPPGSGRWPRGSTRSRSSTPTPPARSATGATSRCSICSATPAGGLSGRRRRLWRQAPCRSEGGCHEGALAVPQVALSCRIPFHIVTQPRARFVMRESP